MGDFNAKHRAWNCYHNNAKGKEILKYATNRQIILNTPAVPTHFSKIGKPSVLDFFIIKNVINVSKALTLPILNSDHNPVFIEISERFSVKHNFAYLYPKIDLSSIIGLADRSHVIEHCRFEFELRLKD